MSFMLSPRQVREVVMPLLDEDALTLRDAGQRSTLEVSPSQVSQQAMRIVFILQKKTVSDVEYLL
jgi:hypothetical protein